MGLRGQEHKQADPTSRKPQDLALVELLATRRTPHQRDPRGNLDTHIETNLQISGQRLPNKKGEKEKKTRVSTKARTRETRIQLCSPTGYMEDLAATIALYYRDTLQLSSIETR
jgi:hypothetical protein